MSSDPRYVDLKPLFDRIGMSGEQAKITLQSVLKPSLHDYTFDMNDDRHTTPIRFYNHDVSSGYFLVHLGAVKTVCKTIGVKCPHVSIKIRLQCIKRPEIHLRQIPIVTSLTIDKEMLNIQNLETIISQIDEIAVKEILEVEHSIALARLAAYMGVSH